MDRARPAPRVRRLALALAVLGSAALATLTAPEATAQTLHDALALAYGSNPNILAGRAELRATDELVSRAMAGWRPVIQLEADAGFTDLETTSNFGGGAAVTEDTLTPHSFSLRVVEPLYRRGRTLAV